MRIIKKILKGVGMVFIGLIALCILCVIFFGDDDTSSTTVATEETTMIESEETTVLGVENTTEEQSSTTETEETIEVVETVETDEVEQIASADVRDEFDAVEFKDGIADDYNMRVGVDPEEVIAYYKVAGFNHVYLESHEVIPGGGYNNIGDSDCVKILVTCYGDGLYYFTKEIETSYTWMGDRWVKLDIINGNLVGYDTSMMSNSYWKFTDGDDIDEKYNNIIHLFDTDMERDLLPSLEDVDSIDCYIRFYNFEELAVNAKTDINISEAQEIEIENPAYVNNADFVVVFNGNEAYHRSYRINDSGSRHNYLYANDLDEYNNAAFTLNFTTERNGYNEAGDIKLEYYPSLAKGYKASDIEPTTEEAYNSAFDNSVDFNEYFQNHASEIEGYDEYLEEKNIIQEVYADTEYASLSFETIKEIVCRYIRSDDPSIYYEDDDIVLYYFMENFDLYYNILSQHVGAYENIDIDCDSEEDIDYMRHYICDTSNPDTILTSSEVDLLSDYAVCSIYSMMYGYELYVNR